MSDDKPTPATPDDAGLTQRLPVADPTTPLPDATRPLPASRPDDPLSIFDEPSPGATPPGATPPGATSPVAGPVPAVAPDSRGPRASTVIWGFIVVAFGVGLVATGAGAHLDVELAAIVLLATAGVLLVIGSAVSVVRRRRRDTVPG